MKSFSPGQSLLVLLLLGLAIGGWMYGVHWKRTASGDLFTKDEKHIVQLQDQINALTEANAELNQRLAELQPPEEPPESPEPGNDEEPEPAATEPDED
ncbi:MAG: hypothetical protein WD342_00625 [Verrucomicrobiales bacterium]